MDEIIKIAIIHGKYEQLDGNVDYLTCSLDKEPYHIVLMLNYLEEHYKQDSFLQGCDIRVSINKIAMYLSGLGEIVFLNTTSYQKEHLKKYGQSGVVLMPDNLTKNQIETLRELQEKILGFNEIQIWYDIQPEGKARMALGTADILNYYINQGNKK